MYEFLHELIKRYYGRPEDYYINTVKINSTSKFCNLTACHVNSEIALQGRG